MASNTEKDDDSPGQGTPDTEDTTPLKPTSMADSLSDSESYQQQHSTISSVEDSDSDDDTTEHEDDNAAADDSDDQVEKMAVASTARILRLRFMTYGTIVFIGIILCVATFGVLKRLALEGKRAEVR